VNPPLSVMWKTHFAILELPATLNVFESLPTQELRKNEQRGKKKKTSGSEALIPLVTVLKCFARENDRRFVENLRKKVKEI